MVAGAAGAFGGVAGWTRFEGLDDEDILFLKTKYNYRIVFHEPPNLVNYRALERETEIRRELGAGRTHVPMLLRDSSGWSLTRTTTAAACGSATRRCRLAEAAHHVKCGGECEQAPAEEQSSGA